jgi:hypothetical protein
MLPVQMKRNVFIESAAGSVVSDSKSSTPNTVLNKYPRSWPRAADEGEAF